jgi:hypothetical protein
MSNDITYREAISAYEALSDAFSTSTPFSADSAKVLSFATSNDLQIRDYLLGQLPTSFGATGAVEFITALLPLVDEAQRAPFYTIMSAFYYEAGDVELATASLIQAEVLDPAYSLAHLLSRVINAGWPTEALAQMRGELHPKVLEVINQDLDHLITA